MLIKNAAEFISFCKTKNIINRLQIERIKCIDGFTFSCQQGYGYYSLPSWDGNKIFNMSIPDILQKNIAQLESVTHFELGFPTKSDDLILEYAEDRKKPTETIYPFVPIEVVIELINKHKGIDTNN